MSANTNTDPSIDDIVAQLAAKSREWSELPAARKRDLLQGCLAVLRECRPEYEKMAADRRQWTEENFGKDGIKALAVIVKNLTSLHLGLQLTYLRDTYDCIARTGAPEPPLAVALNKDGTVKLTLGPKDLTSNLATSNAVIELHVDNPLQNGDKTNAASVEKVREAILAGRIKLTERKPGVVAVLGATNYDAPADILSSLFCENQTCVYKLAPSMQPLKPVFAKLFHQLIESGYLAIIEGGPAIGSQLIAHPSVSKFCLTGGKGTAEKILYPEGGEKIVGEKPFTLELGGCTPWIVCPSKMTDAELNAQAAHLASCVIFNGGHVCVHPQLLITSKNWPQRKQFLDAVRSQLADASAVGCFFPQSLAHLTEIQSLLTQGGVDSAEITVSLTDPNAILSPLPNANDCNILFATNCTKDCPLAKHEAFCPAIAEVPLDTKEGDLSEFLKEVIKYCNEEVAGQLSCTIICKTGNKEDKKALEDAVCDLKYGAIGVNGWGVLTFGYPQLCWGAYPQHCPFEVHNLQRSGESAKASVKDVLEQLKKNDVLQGIGPIGNSGGYQNPLKSVAYYQFYGDQLMFHRCHRGGALSRITKTLTRMTASLCDRPVPSSGIVSKFGTLARMGWVGSGLYLDL